MKHPRPQDIQDGKVGVRITRGAAKYHTLYEFMRRHSREYLYLLVDTNGELEAHYIGDLRAHASVLNAYHANPKAKVFVAYRLQAPEHAESR